MRKIHTIDPVDALKISIQSEKEMKAYYNKASSLVKDDDAKTILQGLAERAHARHKTCINMYSKFSGKKILFLNLDKRHKLNTLQRCSDDPNDAVRVAKRNEKEIAAFYTTISHRFLQTELRSFYREIASEHQQHLALLESSFEEPLTLDQESDEEDNVLDQVSDENPVRPMVKE